jgi:hypothetical protein
MAKNTKVRKDVDVAAPPVTTAEAPVVKKAASNRGDVQSVELQRRALLRHYKDEETIPVNISPMYAKYFGKVMTVSIQGITVAIPCDGKTRRYNKTHAIEALSRVRKIDASITRKERMKNIANNIESTPGELKFY